VFWRFVTHNRNLLSRRLTTLPQIQRVSHYPIRQKKVFTIRLKS
jgi:hypothetical protein